MPNPLTPKRRSELRAEAHKLNPTVIIGDKGLTEEVLAEIDRSLKAHELIKVRAATDERDARDLWLDEICLKLEAHPVQQIGKVFVLFRENPKEDARGESARGKSGGESQKKPPGAGKRRPRPSPPAPRSGARSGATRTGRPPPRTPSPRPASGPRRRPRSTSR